MAATGNLKPFRKGQSGNPGGRPKLPEEINAAARAHTKKAISTLVDVVQDAKAPASARVSAAQAILDRGWGRAQQQVDITAGVMTHEEWLEKLK